MYPTIPALIDQLVEIEASVHDHFEQLVIFSRVTYGNVSSFTPEMLTGWNTVDCIIQLRAPITAVYGDRAAPLFADRIEQVIDEV